MYVGDPPPSGGILIKSSTMVTHTIGNVGDFTQDVVSADLFIALWWADQGLTDHADVDFGSDTLVGRLWDEQRGQDRR